MKRSAALTPLSHDHHVALEVALRLRRASAEDLDAAVERFDAFWRPTGVRHFAIEEDLLTDALPAPQAGWGAQVARMRAEHDRIRALADTLDRPDGVDRLATAHELGTLLGDHVRFEERELFVLLETHLAPGALGRLGDRIAAAENA